MNKTTALGVLVLVVVIALLASTLLQNNPSPQTNSTTTTAAPIILPSVLDSTKFMVQPSYITNADGKYVVIGSNFSPGLVGGAYSGVLYTASFSMLNSSVENNNGNFSSVAIPKNVPIQVYSIVWICNTSTSAQAILLDYTSHTERDPNVTVLNIPKIGDASVALLKVFPPQNNQALTLLTIQFTYRDVYAKVGAYLPLGSTSSPVMVNASLGLLNSIKSAFQS